jgi:hypothetical protein
MRWSHPFLKAKQPSEAMMPHMARHLGGGAAGIRGPTMAGPRYPKGEITGVQYDSPGELPIGGDGTGPQNPEQPPQ